MVVLLKSTQYVLCYGTFNSALNVALVKQPSGRQTRAISQSLWMTPHTEIDQIFPEIDDLLW